MMRPTPPADHPAPGPQFTLPDATPNRRRGRPSTRGEAGITPPPESGWWEDRAPSWHKDAILGGKSSMDFLMEWSEEMKNQGHYYWMGVRDGGNLHQGAARFRDYLYSQHGPIRRSSKAIRNKVENVKTKFFEAQEWLKDPGADHITMSIPDVEKKLNKICRNYRFWETIFVENAPMLDPSSQVEGPSSQGPHTLNQAQAVPQNPMPLIRGIPGSENAEMEQPAPPVRNVRRRLNDGTAAAAPETPTSVGRIPPAGYLERTREEREREKHDLAKRQHTIAAEQLELEKKKEAREARRFQWEQHKHLVDTAVRLRELDLIPVEAGLIKAKALYAQAADEDQANANV
ncbi:hypothetical protein L198_03014 [Cryptococcus wingfieldii CBS 7118]|uniref:Uncharacterized protein n=1 Tax=Cryptococcus wingfieldii CBS 7118 TaxID=1295528 RepID=A0A1E3JIL4_9TREE|nr:hypothetical protein L198_03014 [Cryptococcus wingfieldii CBS 7118]ODO00688.1 hypothetical protein L198_03014 [Cryptococcus wingfieldii CBS 7118]